MLTHSSLFVYCSFTLLHKHYTMYIIGNQKCTMYVVSRALLLLSAPSGSSQQIHRNSSVPLTHFSNYALKIIFQGVDETPLLCIN